MPCFHPRDLVINKPRLVYEWIKQPDGSVKRGKVLGRALKYSIQVPCGKCLACLAEQQSQWSFRIENEVLYGNHASALFVTLTYDNEHLPSDYSVHKTEVQKYLHDLRQTLSRHYSSSGTESESLPKLDAYYFCAEYGSKFGRPHYHAILMFSHSIDWSLIQKSWRKGIVDIREFTSARAGYVAKYSVKQLDLDYAGRERPFHLQSKGIGKCFLNRFSTFGSLSYSTYFTNLSGHKVKLPRYYLDKLGTTRYYYDRKRIDGESYKSSSTFHSYAYKYTFELNRVKMLDTQRLECVKRNILLKDYLKEKMIRTQILEQNLISLNQKSSYYVLSRFEQRPR